MPHTPPFYQPGHYQPDQSVGHLMNKVLSSILAQADAQLARENAIDPAALNRSLNRLEIKGLLQRERSQQDRRVVHLRLTPTGREVAQHVPGVLADVLNGHLQGFSHTEWTQMLQLLQRMLTNGAALKQRPSALASHDPH